MRAIAEHVLTGARAVVTDPELSSQDAVHEFRRAMKEWRALMRLLAPFIPDAERWRVEARDHARSLAHARDGQAALNAFDDVLKRGLVVSERTQETMRDRIEDAARQRRACRAYAGPADDDHRLGSTPQRRLSRRGRSIRSTFPRSPSNSPTAIAARAGACRPDWTLASDADLHKFRQRVVDHRYQMEIVEPLWPRFGKMWTEEAERLRDRLGKCQDLAVLERFTGPHQPLAHWRSRLTPACAERRLQLTRRAARIARRLFAERPKAFRHRLESAVGGRTIGRAALHVAEALSPCRRPPIVS